MALNKKTSPIKIANQVLFQSPYILIFLVFPTLVVFRLHLVFKMVLFNSIFLSLDVYAHKKAWN